MWLGGIGTGLAVALAWWFTYAVSQASFDPVQIQGLTFSGPSAEWLMRVLVNPAPAFGFDAGMLPAVFAVTAQAALSGSLAPLRSAISSWWTVDGGAARNVLTRMGGGPWDGLAMGIVWLAVAIFFAHRTANRVWMWLGGIGTGLAVALAWWFTYAVSQASFSAEAVQMQGLTFSGPSAEWLMRVLVNPAPAFGFDAGMLPAVFAGSFLGALVGREWKVEGFKDGYSMARYIVGAMLMGFGSMLAGGCAVGAGITGGAIFAVTAWVTLAGMFVGGGLMDRLLAEPVQTAQPPTQQAPVVVPVAP